MIRVVAFDLDDTLWNVNPVIIRAEEKLGLWLGREVPRLKYSVQSMRSLRDEVLSDHPEIAHRITEFRRRLIERAMLNSDIPQAESQALSEAAMEVFLAARNDVQFFTCAHDC